MRQIKITHSLIGHVLLISILIFCGCSSAWKNKTKDHKPIAKFNVKTMPKNHSVDGDEDETKIELLINGKLVDIYKNNGLPISINKDSTEVEFTDHLFDERYKIEIYLNKIVQVSKSTVFDGGRSGDWMHEYTQNSSGDWIMTSGNKKNE